jgi:hypothetical protein
MSELFGNLIENGDFEAGGTNWALRNNNGQIDEKIFSQGKRSLKIESHSDKPSRVYNTKVIKVKPNTNYKLSVWIKSQGAENAEIRLISLDKDKKYMTGKEISLLSFRGDREWEKLEVNLNSGDAVFFKLLCKSFGKGIVWFDDIIMEEGKFIQDKNLLRNSSFHFQGNPGQPDFWTSFPYCQQIDNAHFNRWYVDPAISSPVPGTSVVKVKGQRNFLSSFSNGMAEGEYCFSVFLKSMEGKVPVRLIISIDKKNAVAPTKSVEIDTEWKRYYVSGKMHGGKYGASIYFPGDKEILIAAPMIHAGTEPIPWAQADYDKNFVPLFATESISNKEIDRKVINCAVSTVAPEINGKLDDDCWKNSEKISLRNIRAWQDKTNFPTYVMMCRDDDNIYVAFICEAPAEELKKPEISLSRDSSDIFSNDAVELFVANSYNDSQYIHLATDSSGNMYDEQGRSSRWNCDWNVAVSRNKKHWIAELSIPLDAFRGYDKNTWLVNFCRTGVNKPIMEAYCWADPKGFHNPERFGYLRGMRPVTSEVAIKKAFLVKDESGNYQFRCTFNENFKTKLNDMFFSVSEKGTTLFKKETKLCKGNEISIAIPAEFSPLLPGAEIHFKTGAGEDNWNFSDLMSPLASYDPSLDVYPELSFYTEKDSKAKIRMETNSDAYDSISFALVNSAGKHFVQTEKTIAGKRRYLFSVPVEKLNNGSYQIVVEASRNGQIVNRNDSREIIKLPFQKGMVRMNHFKRCLVNESNNYIPRIYYSHGNGSELNSKEFSLVKEELFNSVKMNTQKLLHKKIIDKSDWSYYRNYLRQCHDNEFKVLVDPVDVVRKLRVSDNIKMTLKEALAQHDVMVSELKSPAILAWSVLHEPEKSLLGGENEYELTLSYESIKKIDPYHPVTGIYTPQGISSNGEPMGTMAALDFLMEDIYPFRIDASNPLMDFARNVEKLNKAARNLHLPTGVMLQAFLFDRRSSREPNGIEWQNMVYQSLIQGTRVFSHFIGVPQAEGLWNKMRETNRQLQQLEGILLAEDTEEVVSGWYNDDVLYAVWQQGRSAYLMLANIRYRHREFSINIENILKQKVKSVNGMFGSPNVPLSSGSLKFKMTPAESALYRLEL